MKPTQVIPDQVIGFTAHSSLFEQDFTTKDALWYAASLGFAKDASKKEDLKYVYENHNEFRVFPTVATSFFQTKDLYLPLVECPGMPKFSPTSLVHGEHNLEILKPISPNHKIQTEVNIVDIADKGKGAYAIYEIISYEVQENGKRVPVTKQQLGYYIKGLGGFGHKGKTCFGTPSIPKRKHDKETILKTPSNLSIIFRLNGDFNPHNVDPDMAYPYDRPILHGLCTYGLCAKACMDAHFPDESYRIKNVQARFTSYIYPGETLVIKTWKEKNRIHYNAIVTERDKEVIYGCVDIIQKEKPSL